MSPDPRVPEARRAVARLDAQVRHLSPRADLEEVRSLMGRRFALAQFLNGQGIPTPPPPVAW